MSTLTDQQVKEFKEKIGATPKEPEIKVDYANPAKARADMDKRIKEYYDKSAHELKIVMGCFMDAGFTRSEAFEIAKILVSGMDA